LNRTSRTSAPGRTVPVIQASPMSGAWHVLDGRNSFPNYRGRPRNCRWAYLIDSSATRSSPISRSSSARNRDVLFKTLLFGKLPGNANTVVVQNFSGR
jgi:hypothetical protein